MTRIYKKWKARLRALAFDKPLPPASPRETELVRELRAAFRTFPVLVPSGVTDSEAAWIGNRNRLRELVLKEDPREFLRWDVIQRTMFVASASYLEIELGFLKGRDDWESRWRGAISESGVGHPPPYPFHPESSGNVIHHAYHVAQLEAKAAVPMREMGLIVEFGGGYGSMCRLIHRLGFRGKYVIFDLPHFCALQEFFLKSHDIPVLSCDGIEAAGTGIVCVSDLEQLGKLASDEPQYNPSLFLATWSFSEIPLRLRNAMLPSLSTFEAYFLAYQHRFGEVDNVAFFRNFREMFGAQVRWVDWPIEHLPGNNYLYGTRLDPGKQRGDIPLLGDPTSICHRPVES